MKPNPVFIIALLLAPVAALHSAGPVSPSATDPLSSVKKGAAGQGKGLETLYRELGVSWTYNWRPSPGASMPAGVEFAPMIWGKKDIPEIDKAAASGTVLLGFNEPNREKQANMTVEEALDLWPRLEATRMRLGSPAPAGGGATPGGWLDRFMAGCQERGYRVDFICLHWYGESYNPEAATKALQSYLTAVHERYGKPIWLTEFALRNFKGDPATVAEQQAFMARVLPMLDGLPFVERYSWFVFGAERPSKPNSWYLLSPDGRLSELGLTYAATGRATR